jgi:putative ABC transport system permease protein
MPVQFDVTGDAEPERIFGLHVSLGLFSMVGVAPRLGRDFAAGDGRPGGERSAIISEDLWRRRFGAEADALGRIITLNDQPYTIVGVMPRRFRLIFDKEAVWLPVDIAANRGDASLGAFYGLGRLAAGVRFADAQRMSDTIADRMQAATPLARSWDLSLDKKQVASVDPVTRTALYVLLGAVSFVLFITCANVANLFLSHAPLRLREMAICAALGSGRRRLIAGVLVESLAIAIAGGALGLVLAKWGVAAMMAAAPAGLSFRTTSAVEVDGRIVAVAFGLTLLTGLVIGLLPALRGSRPNIETTLRSSSSAARSSFGRAPAALLVFEVAFSVVLLIGAALMARTLANLHAIEPGFEPSGLIAMHVDLPTDRYPTVGSRAAFFEAAFERLKAVPGVTDVALATGTPSGQGGFSWGEIQGEGGAPLPGETLVPINTVSPAYFGTLRIPIVAGRTFEPGDPSDATIISRGFADRLWPGANAVGRRFRFGPTSPWRIVVGVAANVESRAAGRERTDLQMYYQMATRSTTPPAPQQGPRRRTYAQRLLIVRAPDPSASLAEIKRQIWTIDANQPIDRVALVSDSYAEAFGRQQFVLVLMSVFAAIAVALTAAGIVGVLSQIVVRRTREIGIRMALGARPADVLRQILSRGLTLTLAGAAIGIGASVWLTRVLRALLFGVSPTDPLTFTAVALFLVVIALASCWLPARAAMRIEPASALRVD